VGLRRQGHQAGHWCRVRLDFQGFLCRQVLQVCQVRRACHLIQVCHRGLVVQGGRPVQVDLLDPLLQASDCRCLQAVPLVPVCRFLRWDQGVQEDLPSPVDRRSRGHPAAHYRQVTLGVPSVPGVQQELRKRTGQELAELCPSVVRPVQVSLVVRPCQVRPIYRRFLEVRRLRLDPADSSRWTPVVQNADAALRG